MLADAPPSLASQLPQGSIVFALSVSTAVFVGAGLPAMAPVDSASSSLDTPLSRAGSLPQVLQHQAYLRSSHTVCALQNSRTPKVRQLTAKATFLHATKSHTRIAGAIAVDEHAAGFKFAGHLLGPARHCACRWSRSGRTRCHWPSSSAWAASRAVMIEATGPNNSCLNEVIWSVTSAEYRRLIVVARAFSLACRPAAASRLLPACRALVDPVHRADRSEPSGRYRCRRPADHRLPVGGWLRRTCG